MTKYKGITVELHEKSSCGCGGCILDNAEAFIEAHGLEFDVNSLWEDDSEREAMRDAFEMDEDEIEESL